MKSVREKSKVKSVICLFGFVIMMSGLLSWFIISGAKDILGLKTEQVYSEVVIPKGVSTGQIARILKNKDIIKYPTIFKIYSRLKKSDNTYREGKYALHSRMSYEDIIYVFQHMTDRTDVAKVVIPEGSSVNKIATILKENGVCKSRQDFLDAIDVNNFKSIKFISECFNDVKNKELICFDLEGYLFPDTYEFVLNEKPAFVVETMLRNFDDKVLNNRNDKLFYEKMAKLNQGSNISLHELITLASIVQKESNSFEIMKKVASVFWNRLNNQLNYQRLQSDVTILYVESDIKPNLEFKNQDMYDSYNTYVCKGLPVGPICNPGLDAIKAVLEPDNTDYNYFLTDVENNYYWARSLREHNDNIHRASKVGVVRGLDTD